MLSLAAPLLYQLLRSQARHQARSEGARRQAVLLVCIIRVMPVWGRGRKNYDANNPNGAQPLPCQLVFTNNKYER